ncbi:MAG: pyridoxamine 5'-phosphate oxidase family protein [Pseudomonadota bacterium]
MVLAKNKDKTSKIYSDLDLTYQNAWNLVRAAIDDRNAAFHTPTLATISTHGVPKARTVVLRACDIDNRVLRFHTDVRSQKVSEMNSNPHVTLHFYDPSQKLQLRMEGHAHCHAEDEISEKVWLNMKAMSKQCYFQNCPPGGELEKSEHVPTLRPEQDAAAYKNLCIVVLRIYNMDALYLSAKGHKRALYSWPDSIVTGKWIAP